MDSHGIGARLRQQRLGRGLTIDDISRDTRIAVRFLEAIEADDFESLPGLVFTRNFVRQFALSLKLDPDPLLAELATLDESTIRLPDPPARPRSSYRMDRRLRSAFSSAMWLLAAGATIAAWFHFNHPGQIRAGGSVPKAAINMTPRRETTPSAPATAVAETAHLVHAVNPERPVQVVIRAHQPSWLQVSVDGKPTFTGTLQTDETKELGAEGQVKIVAGNAGALTISLNGKTLDPLGEIGQVRVVRLTAEGPEFLSKAPQPAPDPL
ncbi:MAG: RodZ domain-containing protein [Bryobacteraceae bacterium]